jgi:hypothetical protein
LLPIFLPEHVARALSGRLSAQIETREEDQETGKCDKFRDSHHRRDYPLEERQLESIRRN